MPNQLVQLTDDELALVEIYAQQKGITAEEAATELLQKAIANRVRKKTNQSNANNIARLDDRR